LEQIRFIHTADIHLDKNFKGQNLTIEVARRKREAIRRSFEKVVEAARSADALIIAGDLFEGTPRADTVNFVIELLGSIAPVPVYITPGNHDPYTTGSPYATKDWPENVYIFKESKPEIIDHPNGGFRIMGFAYTAEEMSQNIIADIPPAPSDLPLILIAHAEVVDNPDSGIFKYAPCSEKDLQDKNITYVALGHYHFQEQVVKSPPAWLPGAPEQTKFDEIDRDGFLEVTIDDSGVNVIPHKVALIPYKIVEVDCADATSSTDVAKRIEAHAAEAITRITLTGTIPGDLDIDIVELTALTAEKFASLEILNKTHFARDYASLASQPTSAGKFVRELTARIDESSDEKKKRMLETAMEYGLRALEGKELRLL